MTMSDQTLETMLDAARDPSEAIVAAVAEREDAHPTEVPPLYHAIDPDALDRLFDGRRRGRVTFEYAGYEITVRGPDRISIRESRT